MTMKQPSTNAASQTSGGMTGRERLLRALRGEPADRVPAWLMRQAGRYLPGYQAARRRYGFLELCKTPEAAAEVSVEPLDAIASDAVIVFNDILLPLEHAGARLDFDEAGPLIHNPLEEGFDPEAIEIVPVSPDEPVGGTIRAVRRRVGENVPILGFAGAPWTLAAYWAEGRMGKRFTRLMQMRWSDPGRLRALLRRLTDHIADYLALQVAAGADAVQIFESWGSLLSQPDFARFSVPCLRRLVGRMRELEVPVIVFVNGCAPYLEQLRALRPDAVSVDWRVELTRARQVLGPGIALQGNLDPAALLGGPAAAGRAARELFQNFRPRPGHVFNLGHGVLPSTTPGAARTLIEEVQRLGVY